MSSKTEMKMGTQNMIFGILITCLGSLSVRIGSWFLFVNVENKIVDEAKSMILILLLLGVVLSVVCYLIMYSTYSKRGAQNPLHLQAIAQGQSWVGAFILLIVTQIVLFGILCGSVALLYSRFIGNAAICGVIGLIVDLIFFFLCKMFFKPDMVQKA